MPVAVCPNVFLKEKLEAIFLFSNSHICVSQYDEEGEEADDEVRALLIGECLLRLLWRPPAVLSGSVLCVQEGEEEADEENDPDYDPKVRSHAPPSIHPPL